MKALGKIGTIVPNYQAEKTGSDGHKFWGEKYTIYFESGDDCHMVETKFLHCAGKNGGLEILKKRGIYPGAQGEMIMRYSFRDWYDKRFRDCELVEFKNMDQQKPAQAQNESTADEVSPNDISAEFAEAAEQAAANIDPETGLPF